MGDDIPDQKAVHDISIENAVLMSILCVTCAVLLGYNCRKKRRRRWHILYQIVLLLFITYSLSFIAGFTLKEKMFY